MKQTKPPTIAEPAAEPTSQPKSQPASQPAIASSQSKLPATGPVSGPAQGPDVSSPKVVAGSPSDNSGAAPGSPYSTERSIIRNLTLPKMPNFEIPSSPPGSPPQRSTKKFAQFLDLKKKGQHFNQRLEGSSVIRDPNHGQKLMDFAGINEEDQYASTLSAGLAVPTIFPEWAYVEELSASQKKITKAKEMANAKVPRDSIDFVAATGSGGSSATGTPSGKNPRQNTTERVMAVLDRPHDGKRKELEQRGGRSDSSRSRWRSRSRSPKRRRSRSRERR